jgi:hypothetical protein
MAMPPPNAGPVPGAAALRLIGISLCMGATLFLGMALFLPLEQAAPEQQPGSLATLLSMVHVGFFGMAFAAVLFIGRQRLEAARQARDQMRLNQAMILRWAGLEAPALLGIAVLLTARLEGSLAGTPLLYANLGSYVFFLAALILDLGSPLDASEPAP